MKRLCVLLLFALPAPVLAGEPNAWLAKAMRAEVLVEAEVVAVHPGKAGDLRYVRYRTVKTFLGEIPSEQFEVGQHTVPGKPGGLLILILDPDETVGPKSPWADALPTLFEREPAVAATPELRAKIDDELLGRMFVGGPPYAARVQATPIVALAEVLEVGYRPGLWMGTIIPSTQEVRYQVVEVLKGDLPAGKIEVGYFMIGDTRLTDTPDGKPGLTPALFKPGNHLILLLTPGKCVKDMTDPWSDSGLPRFCAGDVQFGAVPADAEYLAKVRNALRQPMR